MTTCPECQATLVPTASGQFVACPNGHGKLRSPLEGGVQLTPLGDTDLPAVRMVYDQRTRGYGHRKLFEIEGHPRVLFVMRRGQCRAPDSRNWVLASYNGRKHWFQPA